MNNIEETGLRRYMCHALLANFHMPVVSLREKKMVHRFFSEPQKTLIKVSLERVGYRFMVYPCMYSNICPIASSVVALFCVMQMAVSKVVKLEHILSRDGDKTSPRGILAGESLSDIQPGDNGGSSSFAPLLACV